MPLKKRAQFKPPFPASDAPTPPQKDAEVLTNDADAKAEDAESVVVETLPPKKTKPPVTDAESSGPKFVSKSGSTLTREPVTTFLKSDNDVPPKNTDASSEAEADDSDRPNVSTPPSKPPRRPLADTGSDSGTSFFTIGIVVFSLIFGLSGWALYLNTKFNFIPMPGLPAPSETPAETPAPTAAVTPTPANNRTGVTLEVLNGSGKAGIAGQTATMLEKLGYTILSTGNADAQTYKTTEVYVNPKFTTADLLLSDLSADVPQATVTGMLKDSTASARIVIGKDWGQ